MFWSTFLSPPSIRRARLDGSDISVLLDSGLSLPCTLYYLRVLVAMIHLFSRLFTVLQSSKDCITNLNLLQLLQQESKVADEGDYSVAKTYFILCME